MYEDLAGKTALITGAGKKTGIGFAVAEKLAACGANIIITDWVNRVGEGNPLMTAVALSVSRVVLQPDFLQRVRSIGKYLMEALNKLAARYRYSEVRGRGLLAAMRLPTECAETVRDRCFERGLIINAARPNLLRFMPALTVTTREIDEMIDRFESAIRS